MGEYLLQLRSWFGEHETVQNFIISAEDEQMVKYHYHYIQKEAGGGHPHWESSKHFIQVYDDHCTDIEKIQRLTPDEAHHLGKFLPSWPKA